MSKELLWLTKTSERGSVGSTGVIRIEDLMQEALKNCYATRENAEVIFHVEKEPWWKGGQAKLLISVGHFVYERIEKFDMDIPAL